MEPRDFSRRELSVQLQGEIVCHSITTTRIRRDGTKQQLPQPCPGADKLCAILAYLPDPKRSIVCTDWLSTMGMLLGNSPMAERKQALKKHGIVLEPNFEAKVKKMCTLSQGLIEAGRNEVLPQLEAAKAKTAKIEAEKARSDNMVRQIISALKAQGIPMNTISQMINVPIDALQKFLLQDTSESKPTLH